MNKVGVGFASVSALEKEYVMDCLDSGRLSAGKYVGKFEKEFASKHGKRYGVMSNSGTAAIRLALETLKEIDGWDENTEVIVPALTFIATSNAVLDAGLTVRFCDIDPITYNMDPTELEKHISSNTRCIIPVHLFGMPCDIEKVMDIAQKYNLRVIEDCAEAHFAKINGRTVGGFGDLSTFSTYVAHTITTGIGGVTCSDDREQMEILRSLVAHGRACTCEVCIAADATKTCPKRMETEIDRRFSFERLGFSYRVGEIEGALGLAQLERKEEIMEARWTNANYLLKGLSGFENVLQLPYCPDNVEHTYMMFPIVLKEDSGINMRGFVEYLEKNNIETRPMMPLLNQPIYRKIFGDIEKDYPNAQYVSRNGFYIGCHHGLTLHDLEYQVKMIKKYLNCNKV